MKTFILLLISSLFTLHTGAQTMTIAPHLIVLNAQGQNMDVQTIHGGALYGSISSFDISISFAGVEITDAYDFRYCYTDNNFLTTFDRETIMNNPYVQDLANTGEVIASIEGEYTTIDNDGDTHYFFVSYKWDYVEIVKRGKKTGTYHKPIFND